MAKISFPQLIGKIGKKKEYVPGAWLKKVKPEYRTVPKVGLPAARPLEEDSY